MKNRWHPRAIAIALVLAGGVLALVVGAVHSDEPLPAGPIRERHELMKSIGKHAKAIGEFAKKGKVKPIAAEAEAIQRKAGRIPGLFPPGSTDPKSRAKPAIWSKWNEFKRDSNALVKTAGALAAAAKKGGDVKAASKEMFGSCKTCHDSFRKPKKK